MSTTANRDTDTSAVVDDDAPVAPYSWYALGILVLVYLLNFIDRPGAAYFYSNSGVLRSYLVGEVRMLSGDAAGISVSGSSIFAGIRIEW